MVYVLSLPPRVSSRSLLLALPFLSLGSGLGWEGGALGWLVEVGFDHWQKVAMVRFLWRSSERFALQL